MGSNLSIFVLQQNLGDTKLTMFYSEVFMLNLRSRTEATLKKNKPQSEAYDSVHNSNSKLE